MTMQQWNLVLVDFLIAMESVCVNLILIVYIRNGSRVYNNYYTFRVDGTKPVSRIGNMLRLKSNLLSFQNTASPPGVSNPRDFDRSSRETGFFL